MNLRITARRTSSWVYATAAAIVIALTAVALLALGRTLWGPSGTPGLWSGDVNSQENSQRFLDAYTLTHFIHGAGFYFLFWLIGRRWSLGWRGILTVVAEAIWEIIENTDFIINRYRAATLSLDYYGDSVLNSVGDIIACLLAFVLASRLPIRVTVAGIILIEILLALWIRDNLLLNIVMLIYPIPAIKNWQLGG